MSHNALLTAKQKQMVAAILAPHFGVGIRRFPAVMDWRTNGLLGASLDEYRGTSVALWVWPDHPQDASRDAVDGREYSVPTHVSDTPQRCYSDGETRCLALPTLEELLPLPEFSYVRTVPDITTLNGTLSVGTEGTVLTVHPATRTCMVKFYEPLHCVETVAWDNVVPIELGDIPLPEPSYGRARSGSLAGGAAYPRQPFPDPSSPSSLSWLPTGRVTLGSIEPHPDRVILQA